MHNHLSNEKMAELSDLIAQGKTIEAIKRHREHTGLGLKEAKDDIEEIEANMRREFPEKFPEPSTTSSKGCMGVIAMTFLLGTAFSYWLIS